MRKHKWILLAAAAAVTLMAAGCSGSQSGTSTAVPKVPLAEIKDAAVVTDTTGADIELLKLESPIDYCYSSTDTDMIFKKVDGQWVDGLDTAIPLNQERFEAMAQNFLNLKAVEKVGETDDLDAYGLKNPAYAVNITDSGSGIADISIGNQDASGNYYVTLDDSTVYTIKPETVDSMIFDYNSLVIRQGLDLSVTAADIQKVSVTADGTTTSYKNSDTAAMERIAEGINNLNPVAYASYHVTSTELEGADLTEDLRTVFTAELKNGGETQSLTIYVGSYADIEGTLRYVQIDGSTMMMVLDNAAVDNLLNAQEAE